MSSAELELLFERGLFAMQHIGGGVRLAFSSFVIILIICDNDLRNRGYRKYLCSMQIVSLLVDTLFDVYSPIILIHKGLFYSDSGLATLVNMETFLVFETLFLAEVVLSYFLCVYYRRCLVMGPESRFYFRGNQRILFYIFLQVYVFSAIAGFAYFARKSVEDAMSSLPPDIEWVRNRTTFVYFLHDANMQYASYCTYPATAILATTIVWMLAQLVREVKSVRKTSIATQRQENLQNGLMKMFFFRYQRLAVRSLVLQGAVPSLVYIIPSCTNTVLQFSPTIFECGEQFDRFASVVSPIVWLIMAKHTFVCSLTILYCSPSYRQRIIALVIRPHKTRDNNPLRMSEISSRTN